MEQLRYVGTFLGVGSRPVRILKAILACFGALFLLGVLGGAIGATAPDAPPAVKTAFRVAFILVIIVVWVHALRREQRKLDAFVPGLQKQAQEAARTLETRRTNDAWEVQQLEQRLAELKAGLQALVGGPERAQSFEPFADGKLRCPRCWVRRGALVQLIPNRPDDPGMVRCDAPGCGLREKAPA